MAVAIPAILGAIAPEAAGAAAAFDGPAIAWGAAAPGVTELTASSLAGLGADAGYLGTGVMALGQLQSSQAQSESAKYNSEVAANNAAISQQNAQYAGAEGEEQAGAKEEQTRAQVGAITSAQAANGVDVNSGSNLDVKSSASELGELDAINIRANAARQAYGYQTQAANDVAQSNLDKYEAEQASEAGGIGAAATLLTGGENTGLGYQKYLSSNSLTGE